MRILACFLLALSASFAAQGMMCMQKDDDAVVRESVIAFVGEIVSLDGSDYDPYAPAGICAKRGDEHSSCGGKRATISVSDWLRGAGGTTVTILKEDGCSCLGGYWRVGEKRLFIAKKSSETLKWDADLIAENGCSGSGLMDGNKRVLANRLKAQPVPLHVK
jgi:hypothetical protein